MITRCTNPNAWNWKYYGGRGVGICPRWRDSFANFLADMGERPDGMSIDRIDGDKGYEPGNCRWATQTQQVRTSSHTKLTVEAAAEIRAALETTETKREIARRYGVSISSIQSIKDRKVWR